MRRIFDVKNFQDWIPAIVLVWTAIAVIWLWMKIGKSGRQFFGLILVILVVAVFFIIQSFTMFAQETLVATVTCAMVTNKPHTMVVSLKRADRKETETYEMGGDRWMLQSSVIRVQPYLHFLGISSGYSLTRLNPQFDDDKGHEVKPIDLGGIYFERSNAWMYLPLIASTYGSGVIEPCNNANYNVFADIDGSMFAKPV